MKWRMRIVYTQSHAHTAGTTAVDLFLDKELVVSVEGQFIRFEYDWNGKKFMRLVSQGNIGGVEVEEWEGEKRIVEVQ